MPFTVSHAIVAVPFGRSRVPAAAVAVGAMVPDVALYAPLPVDRVLTHSALGVVSIDLLLGIAGLLLWSRVLREPLRQLAPRSVRARIREPRPLHPAWALLGLVIGSATHVFWDAFSHVDGAFVVLIPALQGEYGSYAGYKWVQAGSGALGLAALAVVAVIWFVRAPVHGPVRRGGPGATLAWLAVAAAALLPAAVVLARAPADPLAEAFRGYAVEAVRIAVVGAGCGVLAVVLCWWLAQLVRRALPSGG